MIVEGGIAKFPSGRLPEEALPEAEAAYGREPSGKVYRIDAGTPLAEVNALPLAPGDAVLFQRGGLWRGQLRVRSGKPGHPVTYGAFGDGPAPIIQPSRPGDGPGRWRQEGDAVWSADTAATADVGNVILDHGDDGCLFRRQDVASLQRDRDYFFDASTGRVFVKSESGNPGLRWRSVEFAEKIHAIDECMMHDVVFEGLAVRYTAAHGFGGGGVKRIAIRDCDISWVGGGYLYVDTLGNGVRYGNGIEFWGGAEDALVEGCRVSECWDAGLTNQSNEPGSVQRNIVWRGNEVSRCEYSYEFWHQGKGGTTSEIRLEGNRFSDAGGGWGHRQRWNPNAAHLMLYDTTMDTPAFVIRDNVFSRSADCLCRVFNQWRGHAEVSGNRWESGGEPVCRWHARPRSGLRYLYPDRLDQIHCDDAAEIESQGQGAETFPATEEGFSRFGQTLGFGPDIFSFITL